MDQVIITDSIQHVRLSLLGGCFGGLFRSTARKRLLYQVDMNSVGGPAKPQTIPKITKPPAQAPLAAL